MKFTAILVAVALTAMVTPMTAADEQKETCDNYAFFEEVLGTRPDGYAAPDALKVRPNLPIKHEVDRETVIESLTAQVGDLCMDDIVNGAAESGSFPAASDYFFIYELNYDFTGQHCNQGETVGPGGHYAAAAEATTGQMPWSYGSPEYAGAAMSGISHTDSAYFTFALFADVTGGKAFSYAQDVTYAGASDFYCYGFFDSFFGDYVTINLPEASGVIG